MDKIVGKFCVGGLEPMKSRLSISILLFSLAALLSSAFLISEEPQDEFLEERAELVVRQIGHTLLLSSGDLSSRILPVKQLTPGVFQLEFQNNFSLFVSIFQGF